MSRRSVHPIPWQCRIFGHLWHNRRSRGFQFAVDQCMRQGCPGDDHKWTHVDVNFGLVTERCTFDGCGTERQWMIPDMSGRPKRIPDLPS